MLDVDSEVLVASLAKLNAEKSKNLTSLLVYELLVYELCFRPQRQGEP